MDATFLECELRFSFFRSGGPGGQNVNKTSTAVELRLDVRGSSILSEKEKALLLERTPPRYLTNDGAIVIRSNEHREQPRNREAVLARLGALLDAAFAREKRRVLTRAHGGARRRRRDEKTRRAKVKEGRRRPTGDA